ncbi:hypothetical protein M3664_13020 [Paenibacillus lautus]|nr:hypothetical protein [Paenibacillus lautus]MCM3258718.1 hypothetical protein [Paenibacillus lautus]
MKRRLASLFILCSIILTIATPSLIVNAESNVPNNEMMKSLSNHGIGTT